MTPTIDQRNYHRVKEDRKRAIFQRQRLAESIAQQQAELDAIAAEIAAASEWLKDNVQHDMPEPQYNIRTQQVESADPKEQAWEK